MLAFLGAAREHHGMKHYISFAVVIALLAIPAATPQDAPDLASRLKVPPGFVVEVIAAPPLVHHPMMANFDERGRLFVAESSGLNMKADELLKVLPNKVLLLEDVDAKGRFQKSRVFADKMTFPSGALPYKGSVYVTAAPHIWKLTERPAPNPSPGGRGETTVERTELVSKFNFIGNAADLHGPFLGPDGRIYWCDGRHGHEIKRPDGSISKGKAARIFRCKPDGSEVEVVCGGGMDNPVEIAFTAEGEPLVTVDILHNQPSRNDGIIFAIEGGNYPWHEVSKEFPRTGELLPAVADLGWVAPSGLMRYRSDTFGKEYRNNLFSAQFNRHRIQRHILERKGASFTIKTEDFLTTDDKNFHPTDVFEDADGSLIVIDTGGWFRIGCPTSQIARPEFKGAIYRVRRVDAKSIDDPRGLRLASAWNRPFPDKLIQMLDDPRFAVRDRAIEELAKLGEGVLPFIERTLQSDQSSERIRNAVWAATRIDDPEARRIVRPMVRDNELTVKLAAIHSVGLHRDAKALPALLKVVAKDHPAAQRQAATALGRIRHPDGIEPIMAALQPGADRFLEHALIYALIQIDNRAKTAPYLHDQSPIVRRAALIALDQMPNGNLTREELAAQLNTDNKALLKTALDIVAARPKWAGEIVGLLREWLAAPEPAAIPQDNLRGLLMALAKEPPVQQAIVQSLQNAKTALSTRLLLVETLGQAPLGKLPPTWLTELGNTLDYPNDDVVQQGIAAIRARNLGRFDTKLDRILNDPMQPTTTRVQAFRAMADRVDSIDEPAFVFLMAQLPNTAPPLIRLATAKGLGQAKLTQPQLRRLTKAISAAGPLELPALLSAFEKNRSGNIGAALIAALEESPGLASLTPTAAEKALKACPDRKRVGKLIDRLNVDAIKQKARLDELQPLTVGGSLEQGRDIFFGNKALCSACHAINNKGGGVGPDLGKIGAIRSGRDLLESIVFPSASFARGFEPYVVETKAGKTHTGILARESTDAIYLLTTERVEIRINRDEIETFAPGRVSIMPQGLDAQLSRRELQDLLAYLQSLR
jgi:putative membrane-bound dehydrogenase-like protein